LKKDANGKGNWEMNEVAGKEPAADKQDGAQGFQELAGILIKDSRVSYETNTLSALNLEIGRLAMKTAVPVKASFTLDRGADSAPLSVIAALTATLDPDAKRYGLAAVNLSGELHEKGDSNAIAWRFSAPTLDIDQAAQTLRVPGFTAQYASAQVSGAVSGDKISDAPQLHGSVRLEPVVLRELLPSLGVEPPKTRDPKVLSKLAASANFSYGNKAAMLGDLKLQLDESTFSGNAAIVNLDTKAMTFDLKLDQIDVDRYLSPDESGSKKPDEKPVDLPSEKLKALDANGTFQIGRLRVAGMDLTGVKLTLASKDGLIRVNPIKAALFGGQYAGDVIYDARAKVPAMKLDQQMTGIDMAKLLKATVKSDRLSGKANVTMKLAGQGKNSDALVKAFAGRVEANMQNGAVEGIDLWNSISQAQALIEKKPLPPSSKENRTKFDSFKASADIAGGVATMKDLNIASQNLRVTGEGTANFVTRAINYKILAKILKAPPGAGADLNKLALADIPVNITGTMTDPKVSPDIEGIARAKLQQKIDEKKDELKKKLGDKLQDLFKH
jgi:AsmA protein